MRGEYANKFCVVAIPKGTTSACAENTPPSSSKPPMPRNYLRVRGEYKPAISRPPLAMELPPRARRIRSVALPLSLRLGTTSACAENTVRLCGGAGADRNYLRVRGEYVSSGFTCSCWVELPPRARRILAHFLIEAQAHGTTSACAENTIARDAGVQPRRNYLRVRGEYRLRR